MRRKFLTKTARSQKQTIAYFRDPFKLVPVSEVPEFADKLTRNEVMTSNEIRQIIGLKPSSDPRADELRNKNLNQDSDEKIPEEKRVEPSPYIALQTMNVLNYALDEDSNVVNFNKEILFLFGVISDYNNIPIDILLQ